MFTVTPVATEQILASARSQPDLADPPMLRVAAKFGEDGEVVYGMGFDEEREGDTVVDVGGMIVLIAPRSQDLLAETTLDFVELHPGEFQFVFTTAPTAAPQSGCGTGAGGGCGSCGKRSSNC